MDKSRSQYLYMAKLYEETDRYDEMTVHIKKILDYEQELSFNERNSFSIAYKSAIGSRRKQWKILNRLEKEETIRQSKFLNLLKQFKNKVEAELDRFSQELLILLENKILNRTEVSPESQVYYLKLKADFLRYVSIYSSEKKSKEASLMSFNVYSQADEIAKAQLKAIDPTRLGLSLNFSMYFYQVAKDLQKACFHSKKALMDIKLEMEEEEAEAAEQIETTQEEAKLKILILEDSSDIIKIIKNNLTLWTNQIDSQK